MPRTSTLPSPSMLGRLFLLGSIIGPALDQIHVRGGVLHYPAPDVLGQSWWVFPQFGLASIIMVAQVRPIARWLGGGSATAGLAGIAGTLVAFVAAYAGSVAFQGHPEAYAVALVVAWLARLPFEGGLAAAVHGLSCTLGGTVWEIALSSSGLFSYDAPKGLMSVPIWLPGLYLHAALFLRRVGLFVTPEPR